MMGGLADRARGTVALALQNRTAAAVDRLVPELIELAITRWYANGWARFNDGEVNCTVQLYRWCKEVCRHDRRFTLVAVQFEWSNLTAAMIEGTEDAASASRPDLRVEIGKTGRSVECKRLAPKGTWAHDYVYKGLARFVDGRYGIDDDAGMMVAYVQGGGTAQHRMDVNGYVDSHPSMGVDHRLQEQKPGSPLCWEASNHLRARGNRSFRVEHALVDLTV